MVPVPRLCPKRSLLPSFLLPKGLDQQKQPSGDPAGAGNAALKVSGEAASACLTPFAVAHVRSLTLLLDGEGPDCMSAI
jgi:hypothetical protein